MCVTCVTGAPTRDSGCPGTRAAPPAFPRTQAPHPGCPGPPCRPCLLAPSRPSVLCPRLAPSSPAPLAPTERPSEYLPVRYQTPTPKPPRCPTAWQWVRGSQEVVYATTLCHLPAIWCPSPTDSTPEMPSGADGPYRWLIWLCALFRLPHLVHTKVWHQYTW